MAELTGAEKALGVRVLILCGESVLIKGIEAGLQGCEGVEIVLLDTTRPAAAQDPDRLGPAAIIFDLTPAQLHRVFSFLQTHNDVVLIGLDTDRDVALCLAGEWRSIRTVADLLQVIDGIQVQYGGATVENESSTTGEDDEDKEPHPN